MTLRTAVESAIEEVRPMLHMDGGDCEIVDVDESKGRVQLRLVGACGGCPMSALTIRSGLERIVKERVPQVREVVTVEAF
jgi:Fe-S cluster biogenesis protein NfuA